MVFSRYSSLRVAAGSLFTRVTTGPFSLFLDLEQKMCCKMECRFFEHAKHFQHSQAMLTVHGKVKKTYKETKEKHLEGNRSKQMKS